MSTNQSEKQSCDDWTKIPVHCAECGAQFLRKVRGQKYCDEHRHLAGAVIRPQEAETSNQCPYCGREGGKHNEVCVFADNERLRAERDDALAILAIALPGPRPWPTESNVAKLRIYREMALDKRRSANETAEKAPDSEAEVFTRAVVAGVARWEFFDGSEDRGEVCVGGLRYATRLDVGVPVLGPALRAALERHTIWKQHRSPKEPPTITFPDDMTTAERIGDPRIDGKPEKASGDYRTYPGEPLAGIYEAGIAIVRLGKDDEATGE